MVGSAPPLPAALTGSQLPRPPRSRPARSALGVTSRARSRPAASGRCTAAPPSRIPGVAEFQALEQRRLRLPAPAAGVAPTRRAARAAPPCRAHSSGRVGASPLEAPPAPLGSERASAAGRRFPGRGSRAEGGAAPEREEPESFGLRPGRRSSRALQAAAQAQPVSPNQESMRGPLPLPRLPSLPGSPGPF